MTTERDLRNQMAYARKEAIAEGLAEATMQIARNMRSMELDVEVIAKVTGLTVGEIEKL